MKLSGYFFALFPFVSIFLLASIFYCFWFPLIPDYWHLKTDSKIYERLELIINSLSAMIGLYMSIVIIAFELFRQKSGLDFQKAIKINKHVQLYISLVLGTIIYALLLSYWLPFNQLNYAQVTLVYLAFCLFLSSIILLVPVALKTFSSLKVERVALKEIENISIENLKIRPKDSYNELEITMLMEEDHLYKVRNILYALIESGENTKVRLIFMTATRKLGQLIVNSKDEHDLKLSTERLCSFYFDIVDYSLKVSRTPIILKMIWISVLRIYEELSNNKQSITQLGLFRSSFFSRYFNRLFEEKEENVIFFGITILRQIIENQVKQNTVAEENIISLDEYRKEENDYIERDNPKEYYGDDENWLELMHELQHIFSDVLNKSIKYNTPEIFNHCTFEMRLMNSNFFYPSIGKYKQTYSLISTFNVISDYTYKAFERGVFIKSYEAKTVLPLLMATMIDTKHPAAYTIFTNYCDYTLRINRLGKLDKWYVGDIYGNNISFSLDFAFAMKYCSQRYDKDELFQTMVSYGIQTLLIIKKDLEKKPLFDKYGLYKQTCFLFGEILNWLEKQEKVPRSLLTDLRITINSALEKKAFEID